MTFEYAMCNQRGYGRSVVGNDQGASHMVESKAETPYSFVINKEQQGGRNNIDVKNPLFNRGKKCLVMLISGKTT